MGQQFTSIAKGLNLGGFQESKEEFLEKGKKAQIGEIREWHGQKFQKQPNGGWVPVKQGTKESKKEFDWKKVTVKDMAGVPVGTKISFEDDLSGTRVVAEKVKDNSWKNEEGNTFTDEEVVESVTHPDAHDHKIEKPSAKKEEKKFSKDDEEFLKNFFDPMSVVDAFESEYDGEDATVEDFEKFVTAGGQAEDMGVDTLMSELNLSNKEATDLYRERSKGLLEEVKKNPKKYGFETAEKKVNYTEEDAKRVMSSFAEALKSVDDEKRAEMIKKMEALLSEISKK